MSHDEKFKSGDEHLVYMANQIATFFTSQPEAERVAGVADHINKFWEPRMRSRLFEIIEMGGDGLSPLVLEASQTINRPKAA
ncbi:formate dehydrogenase subunit delta [Nitratireductor kimnyeongensis]|uniref:Formate dehydrogenase subunit delta n=1 Tax=Nitratireductor kimnyeongensis TaxID=430679 RepID=A0ABW0TCV3_9HYPH|nr:formate dehydrogenase subunit delta [Nitratireductor kimnyeongensis]QZZ33991.1 formate dehydrogenase subunit delta [Nitratireductor kimnyeongensis]